MAADALGRLLAGDFRRLDSEVGYVVEAEDPTEDSLADRHAIDADRRAIDGTVRGDCSINGTDHVMRQAPIRIDPSTARPGIPESEHGRGRPCP